MFFKKTKSLFGLFFIAALVLFLTGYASSFLQEIQKTEAESNSDKIIYAKIEGAHGVPDNVYLSLFSANSDGSGKKTIKEIPKIKNKPVLEFFSYAYTYNTSGATETPRLQYAPADERYMIGVYYTDYQTGTDLSSQAGASHKKFYDTGGNEVTSTSKQAKYFKDETQTDGYLSPDGKYFAYTNEDTHKAIIKDLAGGTKTEINYVDLYEPKEKFKIMFPFEGDEYDFPQPVGWSKDSSKLYFLGHMLNSPIQGGFFVYDLAQKKITDAAKWSNGDGLSYIWGEVNIFPDLKKALIVPQDKESFYGPEAIMRIVSVDLETMQATEVSETDTWNNPYFNPGGNKIAAEAVIPQDIPQSAFTVPGKTFHSFNSIWTSDAKGESAKKIVSDAEFAGWSADGKGIAYTSRDYNYGQQTEENWWQSSKETLYITSLDSGNKTQIYSEQENYGTNLNMQYLGWGGVSGQLSEILDPDEYEIIDEKEIQDSFPPDTDVIEITIIVSPEATEDNIENIVEEIVNQKSTADEELDGLRLKIHRQKKNGEKGSLAATAIWAPDGDWSKIKNTDDKSNYKIVITYHRPWLWLLIPLVFLIALVVVLFILLKRKKAKEKAHLAKTSVKKEKDQPKAGQPKAEKAQAVSKIPKDKKAYWWIIAIIVLVLILTGVGFYYYYSKSKETKTGTETKTPESEEAAEPEGDSREVSDGSIFSVTIPNWDEDEDLKKDNPTALAAVSDGKGASVIVSKDALLGDKDFKTGFEESLALLTDLGAKIITQSISGDEAYLEAEFVHLETGEELYIWARYLHIEKVIYSAIVHAPRDKKAEYTDLAKEIIESAEITWPR